MTKATHHNSRPCLRRTSRREFLKLAAATSLLAGCASARQQTPTPAEEPTSTLVPTSTFTPAPTRFPTLTPTPIPIRRPEIIRFHPDAPSKVVQAHHAGVWSGGELAPEAIRQMLDASISELTGLDDAAEAWAALFDPGERIAIKVNAANFGAYWTLVPLVMAVTGCLGETGVAGEQIVIFDRTTEELASAGYPVNQDGPGVRCYGTAETFREVQNSQKIFTGARYTPGWDLLGSSIQLSAILLQCDALINISLLKVHGNSGMTFALKNHYGSFDRPWDFHRREVIQRAIAELNALPPIKDRTRLTIGSVLAVSTTMRDPPTYWTLDKVGDSILVSFDPVAHDRVGLQMLTEMIDASGEDPRWVMHRTDPWLQNAAELGLGTNDPQHVELVEVDLR